MVYIHSDKERQPLVLRRFCSTEHHQNQLKEQRLHCYTPQSIFVTIKLLEDLNDTHTHILIHLLTLSLFISVIVWLFHVPIVWSCPPSFCVSAQSDLNCNNIANWGYCEWRSQATPISCSNSTSSQQKRHMISQSKSCSTPLTLKCTEALFSPFPPKISQRGKRYWHFCNWTIETFKLFS